MEWILSQKRRKFKAFCGFQGLQFWPKIPLALGQVKLWQKITKNNFNQKLNFSFNQVNKIN